MNKLQHYQKYQIWYESAFVIAFFMINATILATSVIMEATRGGNELPYESWKPFVWEYTSAITLVILIPALGWLLNNFPVEWENLKRSIGTYFLASLVYSGFHITSMIVMREFVYWTQSQNYDIGDIAFEFIYEYRKDVWGFIFLLAFISSYRFILGRLHGEASLVAEG